jgi:hypothetical protein
MPGAPTTPERGERKNAKSRHLVFSKLQNTSFSFPFCQKITWHLVNVIKATFSLLTFLSIHTMQQFRDHWTVIALQYKTRQSWHSTCLLFQSVSLGGFLELCHRGHAAEAGQPEGQAGAV